MSDNNSNYFNLLTPRAEQVMALARKDAKKSGNSAVGTEDILLGMLCIKVGVAYECLNDSGVDYDKVRNMLEQLSPGGDTALQTDRELPYSQEVFRLVRLAAKEARALNYPYISTEHLLLALLQESGGSLTDQVLDKLKVDRLAIRNDILKGLDSSYLPPSDQTNIELINQDEQMRSGEGPGNDDEDDDLGAPPGNAFATSGSGKHSALRQFGRDITELARNGQLDPVIGRKREVERVM
ncbi:MAG: hypothetical protein IJJ33_05135, partial [Victivallales bacterium]|nr:hypothetical protein [Victivallales bacterium]